MTAEAPFNEGHVEKPRPNWTSTSLGKLVAGSVIAAEVSPLNEAVRYGALGVAIASQDSALISAAVFAVTTFGVEAPAAIVTADVLDTESGDKTVSKINEVIDSRKLGGALKTGPISEFAVSLFAGSAITTAVKHRQDTTRSRYENRQFGVKTAAELAATMGVSGYLIARGIETPSPETIGGGIFFAGGVFLGAKKALERVKNRKKDDDQGNKTI